MVRLVTLGAMFLPALALASAHRFGAPIAVEVVSVEATTCARPITATKSPALTEGAPAPGRCLSVDLAVSQRGGDGRLRFQGASYLLEQGFAERIAFDFGDYAAVALRELGRGIDAAGFDGKADLQAVAARTQKAIQRHVHYDVLSHVLLPMDIELAVARLSDRYFARARRPLVITSGPRTPDSQAFAMYLKLNQNVSLLRLYRKTEAAREIRKAYEAGRRKRKKHGAIIADMAEVIRQQMQRGVYISPHLKGGAVDIRSRTMNRAAKNALARAVESFRGMRLISEEKIPPHFHLEIKPVD